MAVCVTRVDGVHRLVGGAGLVGIGNRWLAHLEAREFSPATVRGYAFDVVCLARFLDEVGVGWRELVPSDVFDWLEWPGPATNDERPEAGSAWWGPRRCAGDDEPSGGCGERLLRVRGDVRRGRDEPGAVAAALERLAGQPARFAWSCRVTAPGGTGPSRASGSTVAREPRAR